jgi:predicted enzyme related to lactoylglutathione lyase
MPSLHGHFVWYELMTTDAKAAEAFYCTVVGWTARDAGHAGPAYTALLAGDVRVAGLMSLPEDARAAGAKPLWIGYIAVDDVDAYADKAVQAGGKLHRPGADIPGVGRFAMVADPQGAAFVLFKGPAAATASAAAAPSAPGHFGWRELLALDGDAAFDFYAGLFGWTKAEAHEMGEHGVYQLFAAGGETIGGMMTRPAGIPGPPFWTYYIQVDGMEAAVSRVKAGGGAIMNGPMQVPTGDWVVQGRDPQGAMFCLLSPKA